MMDNCLAEHLFKRCFDFIDDVIIYATSERELIANTRAVCKSIFDEGLKLGGLKCEFALRDVEILGHKVSNGFLLPQGDKL